MTVDAAAAPRFPVLLLEIRDDGDGVGQVWLDGSLAADGEELAEAGEGPWSVDDRRLFRYALGLAGDRAGARPGSVKLIRVQAVRPGGGRDELVVDADGRAVPARASGSPSRAGSSMAGLRGLDGRQKAVLAGVAVVAVVSVGGLVGMALPSGDGSATAAPAATTTLAPRPSATPTQLPVLGPDGRVTTARWSVGPVASGERDVVAAGGRVITVTGNDDLAGFDPVTSARVWKTSLGRGSNRASLVVWEHAGKPVVTATSSSRVATVDAATGKVVAAKALDSGDEAVATPRGVVIRQGSVTAQVQDARGRWVNRVVPPGSTPVAPAGTDVLAVNPQGQWWQVASDRVPPAQRQFPVPEQGATPRGVLATTDAGLLFAWSSKDAKKQLVQLYPWTDFGRPAKTFTAGQPGTGRFGDDAARVSPDGKHVVIDQSLVNLSTGKVTTLPNGWVTASVLNDRVYARPADEQVRVASMTGRVSAARVNDTDAAVPLAQINSLGLVKASTGGTSDTHLYAITLPAPPAGASAAPSTTKPAPSATPTAPPKDAKGGDEKKQENKKPAEQKKPGNDKDQGKGDDKKKDESAKPSSPPAKKSGDR